MLFLFPFGGICFPSLEGYFFTVTFPIENTNRQMGWDVFLRLDDFDPIGLMQLLHASSRLVDFFSKKKQPVFCFRNKNWAT